jgi:hypothetical protein
MQHFQGHRRAAGPLGAVDDALAGFAEPSGEQLRADAFRVART